MVPAQGKTLLIISHTPHFKDAEGRVYAWGPTVKEINQLKSIFSHIVHVAPLHAREVPQTAAGYADNIVLAGISTFGGRKLTDKFTIWRSFNEARRILREKLPAADVVHLRLPMGIAVFLLPWLRMKYKKNIWFKYAGNLDQDSPPPGYLLQRFLLKSLFKHSVVTCNGSRHHLPTNYLHFENPCLTAEDIESGLQAYRNKFFSGKLNIIFVGHITRSKGVVRILAMLQMLPPHVIAQLGELIFIGDGETDMLAREIDAAGLGLAIRVTGGVARKELNGFYANAHIILLPSDSEGFPKVIAEAAAYGCVPAVSDVSTIRKYINEANGLVFPALDAPAMAAVFAELIDNRSELRAKASNIRAITSLFTYAHYLKRLQNEVLPRL